jgi:hypothetical protein
MRSVGSNAERRSRFRACVDHELRTDRNDPGFQGPERLPSADPVSRTVLVKLDLPSVPELRSGVFGRLTVHTGEKRAVIVPTAAVVRRGQMELVFVVQDHKARLRIVRTGAEPDGTSQVLSGLEDGELVVVADPGLLVDGQPLEVRP